MDQYFVYAVGLIAQVLFSARLIVQWIKSENAGKVLSPSIFWILSLIASFILMVYGILRNDVVIIAGQILSYFIYIRNLQFKGDWKMIPAYFRVVFMIFPALTVLWLYFSDIHSWREVIYNPEVSGFMLYWGSFGQVIFTSRFVYQWYFSEKIKESILPAGFWIISLIGSAIIISYGIYRSDPVLILGQSFGFFIYIRNLILNYQTYRTHSPGFRVIK